MRRTRSRKRAPGSELAVEQRWYPSTALGDLMEIEEGKLNDTRRYRCLDRILPHKTKLEPHLKQRYGELFGAEFDVVLYDLTSTPGPKTQEWWAIMMPGQKPLETRTTGEWWAPNMEEVFHADSI